MKRLFGVTILIISFLVFASAFAGECVDFSGKYLWAGNGPGVTLDIKQSECQRIDAIYDYEHGVQFQRIMIFDGVKRPVIDTDDLLSLESSTLTDGIIMIDEESHWKKEEKILYSTGKIYLDSENDLIEETTFLDRDGKPYGHAKTVYKRQ